MSAFQVPLIASAPATAGAEALLDASLEVPCLLQAPSVMMDAAASAAVIAVSMGLPPRCCATPAPIDRFVVRRPRHQSPPGSDGVVAGEHIGETVGGKTQS